MIQARSDDGAFFMPYGRANAGIIRESGGEKPMSETVNQEVTPAQEPEKTFTQSELNAILTDRLSRERGKYSDYEELKSKAAQFDAAEEARKTELEKATEKANALQKELDEIKKANEIRAMKDRVAQDTGLPADMLEFLTGTDEEACKAQAKKLVERVKANGFPNVKDSGESRTPGVTKADILAIKNERERLKAIREHIELF